MLRHMESNWELGNKVGNFITAEVCVFMMSELESFIQNFDGKIDSTSICIIKDMLKNSYVLELYRHCKLRFQLCSILLT